MPVVDLVAAGTALSFNGWYRRSDEPPLSDDSTGKVEAWSRDWLHLADGRGWIHSSAVLGQPPPRLTEMSWVRPAHLPGPTAGIIAAPLDYQDAAASCEVAALKMALAARGRSRSEVDLLASVGIDPRPPELAPGGEVVRWGNPNIGFVGDPAGRFSERTGYGVYAAPVARTARAAGLTVLTAGVAVGASSVYAALVAGHPVIAWVTSDYQRNAVGTWKAWDGSTVTYTPREHAVLVIGVTPTEVLINDPWWGTIWRTRAAFEAAYSTLGDMAVVIE